MKDINNSNLNLQRSLNDYKNPYLGPYGGSFTGEHKDIKKFSSDGGWDMWHDEGYSTSSLKKKKKSAALSALTLVAFLFFLNLLQSCLKEQMYGMNPTIMVMTAGAQRDEPIKKIQRSSEVLQHSLQKNEESIFTGTVKPETTQLPRKRKIKRKPQKQKHAAEPRIIERRQDNTTIAPKLMRAVFL